MRIKLYTLIVGDFNTPFSPMNISARLKLNREIKELTDVITQMVFIAAEHFTQTQKNIGYSHHLMETSLKFTT